MVTIQIIMIFVQFDLFVKTDFCYLFSEITHLFKMDQIGGVVTFSS